MFNINKLNVEYWEDFDGDGTTLDTINEDGIFSYHCSTPYEDDSYMSDGLRTTINKYGIRKTDEGLTTTKQRSKAFNGFWGDAEYDYVQFTIKNDSSVEKTYTLSFFFLFGGSPIDKSWGFDSYADIEYELPIKLITLDDQNNITVLKETSVSFPCYTNGDLLYNKEYHEMITSVEIPAGKTMNLQLRMNGELPLCYSSAHAAKTEYTGTDYTTAPHPVNLLIDNIAISTGDNPVINVRKGETYPLSLDTLESDTVTYQTNSYLSQWTHKDKDTTCPYNPDVATVDDAGVITANEAGNTALVAVITHEDGTIERKQCIVQVTE